MPNNPPAFPAKETLRDLYVRFCADSGFSIPYTRAAQMTATAAKVLPYSVYDAFGDLGVMGKIADGSHPAAQAMLTERARRGGDDDAA